MSDITTATGNFQLLDSENLPLTVVFKDAAGNPTSAATPPVWSTSDASIATINVAADGLSATLVTTGQLGNVVVTITDGTTPVTATFSVDIVAGPPASATITPGQPTPR